MTVTSEVTVTLWGQKALFMLKIWHIKYFHTFKNEKYTRPTLNWRMLLDTKPDTIHVTASHRLEVQATYADLFVTVRGASVVSGDEAMKKAKEVTALVDELAQAGVKAEDVHLQGIHIETSSGIILKASNATYRLRIRCGTLERIPALLDILGTQKNAALERIAWKYEDEAARADGLGSAIEAVKSKAQKIASALGVSLQGIYSFQEKSFDEETPAMFQPQAMMMKATRGAAPAEPSLGMDIQHSKFILVNVEVEYRVSGL